LNAQSVIGRRKRQVSVRSVAGHFEENEKGSLEKGKFADFVILDSDLMKAGEKDLLNITVLKTYSGGEKVYEKK